MAMAIVRRMPTLLLEQNAVPGLTNRLLAPAVSAAAVTFESTASYFGRRAIVTGNPVRAEFVSEHVAPGVRDPGSPRVLIFGGSQGAHAINVAMVEAAPELAAFPGGMAITHQTGERDLELVRDGYRRAGLEARVEPFLFAMDREIKSADLVVCRAGATTIAESPPQAAPPCWCRCLRPPTITSGRMPRCWERLARRRSSEQRDLHWRLAGRANHRTGSQSRAARRDGSDRADDGTAGRRKGDRGQGV